ncbi:hypothetical protein GCM10027022_09750 [Alpinimonas psychrophila]|uniref:LysM domain-containing protein n=1 Tax=Alpinimonas psychrophila TaxID=748908 RepID=A0A7W3PP25_9MICO|nr:LysM peptidoglycan-binding domain-containing protein [Alpinimonas psychrophila]MBA8828798.1 hypothetical protein [Alpinimonas psychrophila]
MSAALAFTAMTHRPSGFGSDGDGYIDEPCSSGQVKPGSALGSNVSGAGQSDNVIFVNFLPAAPAALAAPVAGTAPRTSLRLTRRGRRVMAALVALPIVIAAFVFALNGGGAIATAETAPNSFAYVTVEAGQSLWQLASALAPAADPRDVIAEIVSLNQINGDIQPGQRLAIPQAYSK